MQLLQSNAQDSNMDATSILHGTESINPKEANAP